MSELVGESPIELLLWSKPFFEFMEPVSVELRLRNTSEIPLGVDPELRPEFGGVIVYIRRPDGQVVEYSPLACKIATHESKMLATAKEGVKGEDRHSQVISLTYGAYGHYFSEPGEYQVRALYQGAGNMLIPSNTHRFRVLRPSDVQDDRIAQDFYTQDVGIALYLEGSSSPFLRNGMDVLQEIAARYAGSPVGTRVGMLLAKNLTRPFRRIEDGVLRVSRPAQLDDAMTFTEPALKQLQNEPETIEPITHAELRRTRAHILRDMDNSEGAREELKTLSGELEKRGVNRPVLDSIEAEAGAF